MSRRNPLAGNDLTAVRTVGAAVPADVLARVVDPKGGLPGLAAGAYDLELGLTPVEAANRAWSVLTGAWAGYQAALGKLSDSDRATSLTREKWLLVVLRELGFGRVPTTPAGGITVGDRSFPVSHSEGPVPVHLVGRGIPLDAKTPGVAGAADRAPHAMVQELLNRSDEHLWAIVANASTLRLLRDSSTLVGQSYVEFDLATIFDGELFADFTVLYLLCHHSRFQPTGAAGLAGCWLEQWRTDAAETGARALGALRGGVKDAIEALGTGFLRHPANTQLRDLLAAGTLDLADVRRSILRLVYRLLFLFVAEDRGLLLDPDAPEAAKARYRDWFSTARLRHIARRRRGSRHDDQWQALRLVLDGLRDEAGRPELGLPALGGIFENGPVDVTANCFLANEHLLAAVRHLSVIQPAGGGPRRVVDYRNLGAEELGGIYESLLEFVPRHDPHQRTFTLEVLAGNERKTTGAHYTPSSLIDCLLEESLDLLLDKAERAPDPEEALLALRICDPASGSGHFLVAAARRIAHRLARVRAEGSEPTLEQSQHAIRDVVARCVFGIDINPMATELCRVSLWLEALEPGKPLGFLDHHIVVGNGLLGVTPRLLASGVPDAAFTAIEGDDKAIVSSRRKTNSVQRANRSQQLLELTFDPEAMARTLAAEMAAIEALPDDTSLDVAAKAQRYGALNHDEHTRRARLAADTWCAAFVAEKVAWQPSITDETVRVAGTNPGGLPKGVRDEVQSLVARYQFLHWHLAFPQVFAVDLESESETGAAGGFDLIVGNPPWDSMGTDQREFFGQYSPGLRSLSNEEQQREIDRLTSDVSIASAWVTYRRQLFGQVHFLKNSGRFSLYAKGNLGKGDFNVYRNFVEAAVRGVRPGGIAAQITPGGLYGGANASAIRAHLLDACELITMMGLINTQRNWFPEVDIDRFAAYCARRGARTSSFRARFGLASVGDLSRPPVTVPADLIRQQAPESYAIPDLRNVFEMAVGAKLVASHSPLGERLDGQAHRNFSQELNITNYSRLFSTDPDDWPVYEGRMIDHFDHRAKNYISGHGNSAKWVEHEFGDPAKAIVPQWRIPRPSIPAKLGDRCNHYRIGFGDVANPRNERSFVAALIPPGAVCGHKVPTIRFGDGYEWAYLPWLAVANSFTMDWLTRSRLSSPTLSFTVMDGLPFPRYPCDHPLVYRLAPLVLRLSCTSPEMTGYWNAMSKFGWCEAVDEGDIPRDSLQDPVARRKARAEVDAVVARDVFGLTREEQAYVMDQFPVLEKRDRKAFGSFATKELVLEQFDRG